MKAYKELSRDAQLMLYKMAKRAAQLDLGLFRHDVNAAVRSEEIKLNLCLFGYYTVSYHDHYESGKVIFELLSLHDEKNEPIIIGKINLSI